MAEKTSIRVGHIKITDHFILGVTLDKLEKKEETFDTFNLEAKSFNGWNPLADELKSGNIDAAFILAPLAMELFHSGVKVKLILQAHKSGSVLVKNKRANIHSIQDLKGKTVLIPHYLSVHNLLFDRLLRENGIEIGVDTDVRFEVVAPADIPDIMEWDTEGKVGGFIVAEPFGSQVVKAGYGEELALSKDIWPNHPCCVVVIKEEFINKNPDAVQELTNSLVASGSFIQQKPEEAAKIGAKFLNQEIDVVKRVLTEPKDRVILNEQFPVIDDFEYIQTYLTKTISAMSEKVNLEKFIDTRFATAAGAK